MSSLSPTDRRLAERAVEALEAIAAHLRGVDPQGPSQPSLPHDLGAVPEDYYELLARIESNNRPYVKAQTSSASGLYQFTRATWLDLGGDWGSRTDVAFGGLKPSEAEQLERVRSLTEASAAQLKRAGLAVNRASLYACHFLGAGTAVTVIAADTDVLMSDLVSKAAARANPTILGHGKTVASFLSWLHKKTGDWAR